MAEGLRADQGNWGRGSYSCSACNQVVDGQPAVTLFGEDHFCDPRATQHQAHIEAILAEQRTYEKREQYRNEQGFAKEFLEAAELRRLKANREAGLI